MPLSPRMPARRSPSAVLEGRAGVGVVVGDLVDHANLGLADLLDARVLQPGQRAGIGHMRVEHGSGRLWLQLVDGRVDAISGALDVTCTALHLAVVDADLHERAGLHLRPVHAERDLIVAVGPAGHRQGQVVEDALVKAVHHCEPVGGGKIDAGLPFLGAAFLSADGRNLELHLRPPGSSGHGRILGFTVTGERRHTEAAPLQASPTRRAHLGC